MQVGRWAAIGVTCRWGVYEGRHYGEGERGVGLGNEILRIRFAALRMTCR